ncbi:MAG: calcium-binding protein, partial [Okeania sp. SIO2D1]|nr:calcium-binding protein [Okeania sp. SIO2D1]
NPNNLATDQRGQPRFAGEGVDIGAVELQTTQEIMGTAEADFLNGTIEQDSIFGLDGNDVINGLDDDDVLFGNRDLDTLNGDAGNDTIYGGRDDDLVFGNIGEDFLRGDRGSDSVFGQEGNDIVFGGKDSDLIDGGFGNDSISGDLGSDTLIGGQGIDTLTGGEDADIFELAVGEGLDMIADFVPQQDIILLDKSTFTAITSDSGTGFSVDAEFAIVTSDFDAETSEAVIVYNSNNGKLFYNTNGTAAEFGSGGEFANLTNIASISENDFLLRG